MLKRTSMTVPEIVGIIIGVIVVAALAIWFQAWLLGVVLGWFGVQLEFWKTVVIIILLNSIFGGSKVSN